MEYVGNKNLIRLGGSYALVLPLEWVRDNRLDGDDSKVRLIVKQNTIALFPAKQKVLPR